MSDPMAENTEEDPYRDAKDYLRRLVSLTYVSTGIFFVMMLALRLAHHAFGLGHFYIYIIAAIYFILTIAFFLYYLGMNFTLLYRFVQFRRKATGEIKFGLALVLSFAIVLFDCVMTIFKIGFDSIIKDFIDNGNIRVMFFMHLAIPYLVIFVWVGVCEFGTVRIDKSIP
jgi:hypothetical protein